MTKNDIKKYLYKEKPHASFINIQNGIAKYIAVGEDNYIYFNIPVSDMGNAKFSLVMDAKLLIRWISMEEYA